MNTEQTVWVTRLINSIDERPGTYTDLQTGFVTEIF